MQVSVKSVCAPMDSPSTWTGNAFSVWDLSARYKIDPQDFLSRGRATPFEGWTVQGKCLATFYGGQAVYQARK